MKEKAGKVSAEKPFPIGNFLLSFHRPAAPHL